MRVIILPDPQAVSSRAADFVEELLAEKPDAVLGLATGGSPVGLYKELIRRHSEQGLDFSSVTTFNLDEYVGLGPDHPQSYRHFMQENLFNHINVVPERTNVPDGLADDLKAAAHTYEQKIQRAGGIDLQVLGIGRDGHIAFNEPGSSLASRTRVKTLAAETISDNERFFENPEDVPRIAVTMGVGTILEARQLLLIAYGESKAEAIRGAIEGPVSVFNTASALQLHPNAVFILDSAAANRLERKEYYLQAEEQQRLLEGKGS